MKGFKKRFLWLSVIALSALTAIIIVIVLIGNYSATEWRILGSAAIVFVYCIGLFLTISKYQSYRQIEQGLNRPKDVRIIVPLVACIAYFTFTAIILIISVWDILSMRTENITVRLVLTFALTAAAAVLVTFVLPQKKQDKVVQIVRWTTIGITLLVTTITAAVIWFWKTSASTNFSAFMVRLYLVSLILMVFGTILTPIVTYIYKIKDDPKDKPGKKSSDAK